MTIRDTKVLFDKTSIHATEYSLKFFSFRQQVTIQAVDLAPGDEITFEIVHLESGTSDELCGCFIRPGEMPRIASTETLLCFECDDGEVGEAPIPVRVTSNNPVVILNAPQNVILRAKYEGEGLGQSTVWATLETSTSAPLLPGQDGCIPNCCEHDEESWRELGPRRCNLEEDILEAKMIDNCGVIEWREIEELNWQDTGQFRCSEGEDEDGNPIEDGIIEIQQVNDCGDIRWVEDKPNEWVETGEIHCTNLTEDEDFYEVVHEERDLCGNTRWTEPMEVPWRDTGKYRCVESEENEDGDVEKQQETVCGQVRWIYDKPNKWVRTGQAHCTELDLESETYELIHEERDLCGNTRWTEPEEVPWRDTGLTRCIFEDAEDEEGVYEKQQITACGHFRWVELNDPRWTDTGVTRCEDHLVQRQQVNDCGDIRWEDTEETCGYFATYPLPCEGFAFRPGEEDPEATVAVKDCDDETIAFIYPEPRDGATTAVTVGCEGCGEGEVLGYAVNGASKDCDPKDVKIVDHVGINVKNWEPVLGLLGQLQQQIYDQSVKLGEVKTQLAEEKLKTADLSDRLSLVENEINNAGCE